jgi:predicted aspartyl protease
MSFAFDPDSGLIVVRCELRGPSGEAILRLALDTGATRTTINAAMLTAIGYDPALSPERFQVTMGSGVEYVPRIVVEKMSVLGQVKTDVSVLCHTLPPSAGVDGVLGVDFFRKRRLIIDFSTGTIEVD